MQQSLPGVSIPLKYTSLRESDLGRMRTVKVAVLIYYEDYCAFDIFQKVDFCLALYIEEKNLQTFAVI